MKIKIVQDGWAGFNGLLGTTNFVDGVSEEDVTTADAAFLAGIVAIEEVGTGLNPSSAQIILDTLDHEAAMESAPVEVTEAEPGIGFLHTKESLEAVADSFGIKGIREIAEPLGISGTSIVSLIEKILASQADPQASAASAPAA